MARRILAVLAGIISGCIVVFSIQAISHQLYPVPEGLDFNSAEAAKLFIASLPIGAFLMILLSYLTGSLVSGFVAALLVPEKKIPTALITGTIFFIFGILNILMIPHPVWFAITSSLIYHPFSFIGGILAIRLKNKNQI